ncbi:hypothetical protein B0O80DRAFT_440656 [Mortierella sp. GBAus27b]|nr:hypothetical protein B0O80DRAFT_440656 [Mortierella sp. GBAus27b]
MLRTERRKPSTGHASTTTTTATAGAPTPMRRKRRDTKDMDTLLKLERVLGLTTNKPMILSVNPTHDLVAYAAGCVVVLYNHKLDKQVGLICSSTLKKAPETGSRSNNALAGANFNPASGMMSMSQDPSGTGGHVHIKGVKPKPISCLAFSPDGQYLAVGETGHQPRIFIIEVATQLLVTELLGHSFGVQAVYFSPNSKILVSLGFQHDGFIYVWNWKTGVQLSSNKVTTKVNAISFSADGSYFVTAGLRHFKFWYLSDNATVKRGFSSGPAPQLLEGRAGTLGDQRNSNFVDAVCSKNGRLTYVVTSNGLLCAFNNDRAIEKVVNLDARGAYSVNLTKDALICACTDGIIRLYEPESLEFIASLPKPPPVGSSPKDIKEEEEGGEGDKSRIVHADVLASQYDPTSNSLVCIYSDRTLVVWNITDYTKAVITRSHVFHSDSVWGAEIVPSTNADDGAHQLPPDTFLTYSSDGSIKFWNLDESISALPPTSDKDSEQPARKSGGEVLRVLYVDEKCRSYIQAPEIIDGMEPGFNIVPLECGIRTIKISPDGRHLATGDKQGNLRVHSMSTFQQTTYQEAHDAEILAIDFTNPANEGSPYLIASAGRDRLLHVFDVQNDYHLLQTLDDHSSSITCIKFTADGSRMMSCGADKSVVFRNKNQDAMAFQPYHQAPGRSTFYEMGLHNSSQTISVVAGDRKITSFTLETGKTIKSFKAELKSEEATLVEVCSMTHMHLDPTGTIAVTSGSDKSIRIYDLLSGNCLADAICHSELVTSVRFMHTYDRVISTSADGCVLVWRVPKDITRRIFNRIQENITLPGYLKSKAVEKAAAPSAPAAHPKTAPAKRPTEKSAIERTRLTRRDSTTSLASEDEARPRSTRTSSISSTKQVTTPKGPVSATAARARTSVTKSSAAAPPAPRSRQGSISGTTTSKTTATRTGTTSQTTAQKAKPTVKTTTSPSTARTSIFHRSTESGDKNKLGVGSAGTTRSRASSISGPSKPAPKSDKAAAAAKEAKEEENLAPSDGHQDPASARDEHDGEASDDTSPTSTIVSAADTLTQAPEDTKSVHHDSDHGASEADEVGESEGRDGDDESADDHVGTDGGDSDDDGDESLTDSGSDAEYIPHAHRRAGDTGAFGEGEQLTSPLAERTYRLSSLVGFESDRKSLSARYLAAHAAQVMLDLLHKTRQNSIKVGGGEAGTTDHAKAPSSGENDERPLEERLNLRSLNSVAQKWKLRALGGGSGGGASDAAAPAASTGQSDSAEQTKEEYQKEVERTRKRLLDLGLISTTAVTQEPEETSAIVTSPDSTTSNSVHPPADGTTTATTAAAAAAAAAVAAVATVAATAAVLNGSAETKDEVKVETTVETKVEAKEEAKVETKEETKVEAKEEVKVEAKEVKAEAEEVKVEAKEVKVEAEEVKVEAEEIKVEEVHAEEVRTEEVEVLEIDGEVEKVKEDINVVAVAEPKGEGKHEVWFTSKEQVEIDRKVEEVEEVEDEIEIEEVALAEPKIEFKHWWVKSKEEVRTGEVDKVEKVKEDVKVEKIKEDVKEVALAKPKGEGKHEVWVKSKEEVKVEAKDASEVARLMLGRHLQRSLSISEDPQDSTYSVTRVVKVVKIQAERDESRRDIQEALDKISLLISQRAKTTVQHDERAVDETRKWMLETREGLLNLVGQLQGHLWASERK